MPNQLESVPQLNSEQIEKLMASMSVVRRETLTHIITQMALNYEPDTVRNILITPEYIDKTGERSNGPIPLETIAWGMAKSRIALIPRLTSPNKQF